MDEVNVELSTLYGEPILTYNLFFDRYLFFSKGMSVLVLDETFSEGKQFVKSLFRQHIITELATYRKSSGGGLGEVRILDTSSLQYLSVEVNKLRKSLTPRIIIHSYLPELLVKHGSDNAIKMLALWQDEVKQAGHLEFYILPKGTFADYERKLMAVVDGAIEITVTRTGNQVEHYFTPIRLTEKEYHLKPVRYSIEDGNLIVKEGLDIIDVDTVKHILEIFEKEPNTYIIPSKNNDNELDPGSRFLLKEIAKWKIEWVKQLFPDSSAQMLKNLAKLFKHGKAKIQSLPEDPSFDFRELGQSYAKRLKMLTYADCMQFVEELAASVKNLAEEKMEYDLVYFLRSLYGRLYAFALWRFEKNKDKKKLLSKIIETMVGKRYKVEMSTNGSVMVELSCPFTGEEFLGRKCLCHNIFSPVLESSLSVLTGMNVKCTQASCIVEGSKKCILLCLSS